MYFDKIINLKVPLHTKKQLNPEAEKFKQLVRVLKYILKGNNHPRETEELVYEKKTYSHKLKTYSR